MSEKRIFLFQGPNLNRAREPELYGEFELNQVLKDLGTLCQKRGFVFEYFQSNHEGELIDRIHDLIDNDEVSGLVYNFGGLSHSSVSLLDAVSMLKNVPRIEVHLSHLAKRESYRQQQITAAGAHAFISGLGYYGYLVAAESIIYFHSTEEGRKKCMIPTSFAKD